MAHMPTALRHSRSIPVLFVAAPPRSRSSTTMWCGARRSVGPFRNLRAAPPPPRLGDSHSGFDDPIAVHESDYGALSGHADRAVRGILEMLERQYGAVGAVRSTAPPAVKTQCDS